MLELHLGMELCAIRDQDSTEIFLCVSFLEKRWSLTVNDADADQHELLIKGYTSINKDLNKQRLFIKKHVLSVNLCMFPSPKGPEPSPPNLLRDSPP